MESTPDGLGAPPVVGRDSIESDLVNDRYFAADGFDLRGSA